MGEKQTKVWWYVAYMIMTICTRCPLLSTESHRKVVSSSFLSITSTLITTRYRTLTSLGMSYPKTVFRAKHIFPQIFEFVDMSKRLAFICPYHCQQCCWDWDCQLLVWGFMKKLIKFFQPNSLHILEEH